MIGDMIFKSVDDKSLETLRMANRDINTFISDARFFWLRKIGRYSNNFQEFQKTWNKTIKRTSTFILMDLAQAVDEFFKGGPKKCPNVSSKRSQHQWSPLHIASAAGNLILCQHIAGKVRSKIPVGQNGLTPMHLAAQQGHLEIVNFLNENGYEKNPGDERGDTPLHRAARHGHFEVFNHIFGALDEKNPGNKSGDTPLHVAARYGSKSICQLILDDVTNKNPGNRLGLTPLHIAATMVF